jgi:hypothetical protein
MPSARSGVVPDDHRLAETVEHTRRNPDYQIRNRENRIYEAGVGVKQKINELRFGRQADWWQVATCAFSSLVG